MQIQSNFSRDVRQPVYEAGGYQWWYFDGISSDDRFSFVIIYYEGNPFSTRYNRALLMDKNPSPTAYPAISISIYEHSSPIYYSFTEFDPSACFFDEDKPLLKVGDHKMEGTSADGKLQYKLSLKEQLPNGDRLQGSILFESVNGNLVLSNTKPITTKHSWNLVQPRAEVSAELNLHIKEERQTIQFTGRGYHDHNTGREPMRNQFDNWYWGRFHYDSATFMYYVLNRREEQQHHAWLLDIENGNVVEHFNEISLADKGVTFFGLQTSHKLGFKSDNFEIQVQQSQLLDNGPFYRRYQSDAFMRIHGKYGVASAKGISEYIRPDRIYARIFWPFVNMRIWYKAEGSHWVQRSKRFYRWTW